MAARGTGTCRTAASGGTAERTVFELPVGVWACLSEAATRRRCAGANSGGKGYLSSRAKEERAGIFADQMLVAYLDQIERRGETILTANDLLPAGIQRLGQAVPRSTRGRGRMG